MNSMSPINWPNENKCILLYEKKVFVLQPTYVSTYINYVQITPCFLYFKAFYVAEIYKWICKSLAFHIVKGKH